MEDEVNLWLEKILDKENLHHIVKVQIQGTSEKGDGYLGDIAFVHVQGCTEAGSVKNYNLVLKCSKRSQLLRENSPVKEAFLNEIFVYNKVLPTFKEFELMKGVEKPFNSIAKIYGIFTNETMEVIALENLKKSGYVLWDRNKTLTRKHINLVIREYGKFHAISVAMNDQNPKKFQNLTRDLCDVFKKFVDGGNMTALIASSIEESYDALQNDLEECVLEKWRIFKEQINFVFKDMSDNFDGLKVILHGDCWNNNFMFYSDVEDAELPSQVAIIDWQISRLHSPIFDLSYFLFACISEDDIEDLDPILSEYYNSFSNHLRKLGSNPHVLYPFDTFLNDWKMYCKFGIFMASIVMRINSADQDDVPDIVQAVEKGKNITDAFIVNSDKTKLKEKMRHIIKYAVENDLLI